MVATSAEAQLKTRLRKFLSENKGMYKRAKAILDDPKELKDYEGSALALVRMYNIGDSGEIAIGLLSAARQLLVTIDLARESVEKFEDTQGRLEALEDREMPESR